jgi:uncharacterized protein YggE
LCCSIASGQFFVAPGPETTLSVTVAGSAEAPAEWAELALSVEGRGATAQEALAVCDESWQKVVGELGTLQIAAENIRSSPPEIGPDAYAQMMGAMPGEEGGEDAKHAVRRNVTVRLTEMDPQTLYEDLCRIIDVAGDAGATLKTAGPMQQVYSRGAVVTFGVNDPKPLQGEAIRNGLAAAKEAAEVVAGASGRKLGDVASVQIAELGPEQGYLGMIGAMFYEPQAGRGRYDVSLTVTYRLQ